MRCWVRLGISTALLYKVIAGNRLNRSTFFLWWFSILGVGAKRLTAFSAAGSGLPPGWSLVRAVRTRYQKPGGAPSEGAPSKKIKGGKASIRCQTLTADAELHSVRPTSALAEACNSAFCQRLAYRSIRDSQDLSQSCCTCHTPIDFRSLGWTLNPQSQSIQIIC